MRGGRLFVDQARQQVRQLEARHAELFAAAQAMEKMGYRASAEALAARANAARDAATWWAERLLTLQ